MAGMGRPTGAPSTPTGVISRRVTTTVRLDPPRVDGQDLVMTWTVDPPAPMYRRTSFRLGFPTSAALAEVPEAVWWTVVLLALHAHWLALRPCRVEIPVVLPPGELEVWRRMLEAALWTHELTRAVQADEPDPSVPDLAIELVAAGPAVSAPTPVAPGGPATLAFSGGKDSLLHVGLLRELGVPTVAVATTSPLPGLHDHETPRRRAVLDAIGARGDLELVEVASDLRGAVDNDALRRLGWDVSLNEVADTHLYLAAALVVAWVRGSPRVLLASEAELQEMAVVAGCTVQHPHLMYSAATQRAIDGLLGRWGVAHGSLTYPLRSEHVQLLLWSRYRDLRDLQYSCWRVGLDEATCSACSQCLRIALGVLAAGGDPADIGIDLVRLMLAQRDWAPSPPSGRDLPDDRVKASLHGQVVRHLAGPVTTARMARRMVPSRPLGVWDRDVRSAIGAYRGLRRRVRRAAVDTEPPPYRRGFLDLVEPGLREGLTTVYDSALVGGDPADDSDDRDRIEALAAWMTAPLGGRP